MKWENVKCIVDERKIEKLVVIVSKTPEEEIKNTIKLDVKMWELYMLENWQSNSPKTTKNSKNSNYHQNHCDNLTTHSLVVAPPHIFCLLNKIFLFDRIIVSGLLTCVSSPGILTWRLWRSSDPINFTSKFFSSEISQRDKIKNASHEILFQQSFFAFYELQSDKHFIL